jgi:hypothetical protein
MLARHPRLHTNIDRGASPTLTRKSVRGANGRETNIQSHKLATRDSKHDTMHRLAIKRTCDKYSESIAKRHSEL